MSERASSSAKSCPLSLLPAAGRNLYLHTTWLGWKRWLRGPDEGRGLGKEEDSPIHSLIHLIRLSLTFPLNGGVFSGPEPDLASSMGHLVSRGLCYLGHIYVLRATPLNPGVPSPFGGSLTVTEGTGRHPSSSLIQLPVVLGTLVFLASCLCLCYPEVVSLSLCGCILRTLVTVESRSFVLSVAGLQLVNYIPNNQTQRKHCLNTWVGVRTWT